MSYVSVLLMTGRWIVAGRGFGFGLERGERLIPELIEPGPQRTEPVGVDVVDATGAFRPVRHQARLLQHLEMLRHRGPAHRHAARDGADRLWPRLEPLEHPPAGGIGQGR